MLWIKVIHVLFVIAWMAGVFYLPRILVHAVEGKAAGEDTRRLVIMAEKLVRFSTVMMVLALIPGTNPLVALWLFRPMALLEIGIRCGARRVSMAILPLRGATQAGSGYTARFILSSVQRSGAVFANPHPHPCYCEALLNDKVVAVTGSRPKKAPLPCYHKTLQPT